jgi:hypothetical protein
LLAAKERQPEERDYKSLEGGIGRQPSQRVSAVEKGTARERERERESFQPATLSEEEGSYNTALTFRMSQATAGSKQHFLISGNRLKRKNRF